MKAQQDSANGATLVNGPAALSVINDAYHIQSTADLLHFCLCPSFDAATDNTLIIRGRVVAYEWYNLVLLLSCFLEKKKKSIIDEDKDRLVQDKSKMRNKNPLYCLRALSPRFSADKGRSRLLTE